MKKIVLMLVIVLLLASLSLAENTFYPTVIGEMTAEAKLYGRGTISGLEKGEETTFQTLTFQETNYQQARIIKEELYINGNTIYPKHVQDEYGNKYVIFTIRENGEFNYELIAEIKTRSIINQIQDYNITTSPESVKQYLSPSEKIESTTKEIITVTKNKLLDNTFLKTLEKTIRWVNDYVEYPETGGTEFNKYYVLQKSALDTLLSKKGVCDEFSNLASALLRAKGIPTRIVTGITFDGRAWGNHAWIEVYNTNLNEWIPSDPTFRESGFVDATHIKIGAYTDVTLSLAKVNFPQTAKASIYTQTIPEVKIISKEYFDEVKITGKAQNIKTKQWNDINISVENKTNQLLLVPVKLSGKGTNYLSEIACTQDTGECIIADQSKRSIELGPKETKTITFKIYPDINLNKNQLIKTNLQFYSLTAPYQLPIEITMGNNQNTGEVTIEDITPIIRDQNIQIQITATNYFPTEKNIDINIMSQDTNKNQRETISGFTNTTYLINAGDINKDSYTISIETPNTRYTQIIVPEKQETIIRPVDINKQVIIAQKIEYKQQKPITDILVENPTIILIATIMGVAVLLFGLLWINRKYI